MSLAVRSCALLFAAVAAAQTTTDTAVQALFDQARTRVNKNIDRTPRYTCVENIVRTQYQPPPNLRGASCSTLVEARRTRKSTGDMIRRDRLRVDVAVVNGAEMFSWAGAGKFETDNMEKLVGSGSTGSGDFVSFLSSVFGEGPDVIRYRGIEHDAARFDYNVPLAKSHYYYHTRGPERNIGYSGSFWVDPSDGELQRLTVETDVFPQGESACKAVDDMSYHTVQIGSGEFLLPEVTTMNVLFQSGAESRNETRYSDCREYVGESTIRFDDVETSTGAASAKAVLPPVPPKVRLQIALNSPINGETSAAGDSVVGVVLRDVKEKGGNVPVHAGDKIHGRIVRLEQTFLPTPAWTVGLRFETIERHGVEQPVFLQSVSRGALDAGVVADALEGDFRFTGRGGLLLDEKFHSEWETR